MMLDMRKSLTMLLLLFFILIPAIVFADAESIFRENSKAVVVIVTFDSNGEAISQGSGFIIRADGVIVTNYHVISNAVDIKVKVSDKILDVEGLIYKDEENDLVILKAKGEKLPAVKTGDFEKTNVGEKVYVISSPEGLENTISDGILSGIRDIDEKRKILQITAPVSEGSSGGPVFNKDGEVIGVATFIIRAAQNLNFVMPVNVIKDIILDEKIVALKDAGIVDYKKSAEYWFYLGVAYLESGRYQDAVDVYKQAIRINPNLEEIHYNLGVAYYELGRYQEEIDAYKQAIKINPNHVAAHINLGVAYDELGRYQEAIDALKQAIRINPDDAEAHNNLGNVYVKLDRYQEAIEAYKQAIRINPDYAKAHIGLGVVNGKLGKYQEAVDALKQAVRINPDDAYAHYNLGVTYLRLDDKGSALEEYKILKDIDKELANKLFNIIYK